MRVLLVVLVFASAGLLAVDLQSSSAPRAAVATPTRALANVMRPPQAVEVAFVKNGWIVRVERVVPKGVTPQEFALRELTQGPTKVERRRGIRTALPARARLRSLRATPGAWFASFSRSTFGAGSAETKRSRLWQIAATLAPLGEQREVAVAAEGRYLTAARLGVRPGQWRAETGEKNYAYAVRGVQLRLAALGYLDRSDATGSDDYLTDQALLAFQGWEDLDRTGTVTGGHSPLSASARCSVQSPLPAPSSRTRSPGTTWNACRTVSARHSSFVGDVAGYRRQYCSRVRSISRRLSSSVACLIPGRRSCSSRRR